MENLDVEVKTGIVQYPHLHDSILIGVMLDRHSARLRFQTVAKQIICVGLQDVHGLSAESVFEYNIIFEIRITPVAQGDLGDFQRVLHHPLDQDSNKDQINKLKSEKLIFMQVNPVLGADILILCREATWQIEQ